MTGNDTKIVYTVTELQNLLPLGKNSLYKLVNRSDFPKIRCGRKILIPVSGLEKWLKDTTNYSL